MSSSDPPRVVYQFPISHFCEKTRWNLDAKGLLYRTADVVPGLHLLELRRLSSRTTVPLLLDGTAAIGNSASIAQHLDRAYPERKLIPLADPDRARVRELEAWFGTTAGRAVRVWMYGQLGARPGGMAARLFADYSPRVRRIGGLVGPLLERGMRRKYGIHDKGIAAARERILESFARVEAETSSDPSRYLVGSQLSIADISAAALLGPLVAPPGSPWARGASDVPRSIAEFRREMSPRPAWKWVEARYAEDRARAV